MVENYQKVLMLTTSSHRLSAVSGRVYYSGQFGFNTVLAFLAFVIFFQRKSRQDHARIAPPQS
ncbi:hypothetical protein CBM2589_A70199 [Cupriavidus taiwanensis]|uniref:Uncharacterized protein n=1 Tax=Cupriavidus taiwanensis TaxID=164546 RepID=A0A976A6B9_9BURK|nr:hypothetical protein CBM2589_A70199 [Cupriavidus taiwanensis]